MSAMDLKGQKFVKMHGRQEIKITACAVSKMAGVADRLPEIEEYKNYFVEPNQKWLENPLNERAWVKVYCSINPETDLVTVQKVQVLKIRMPFLGDDHKECWGELQFLIKEPKLVKLVRHRSFDTRINQWVEEKKLIQPKTDFGNHAYLALRFYHQDYLPEIPDNWHFEPVFIFIPDNNFYEVYVRWGKEEIIVTTALLDRSSSEIPKLLK